jgi:hypothetical protein
MINKYFKCDRKLQKLSDSLLSFDNSLKMKKKLIKKISKLNEFQFIVLFNGFIIEKGIDEVTENELMLFILTDKIHYPQNPHLGVDIYENECLSDDELKEIINSGITLTHESFNCKNKIEKLVKNLFIVPYQIDNYSEEPLFDEQLKRYNENSMEFLKEFPKTTQITKLNYLRDKIINNFLAEISILSHFITKNISLKNTETNKKNHLIFILEEILKLEEKLIELDNVIVNKINSYKIKKEGNYFIDTNTELLIKLYSELEKNDFIDIHKTSQEEFIEVLKSDWDKHNSIIHLKIDSIQFGYLLDCLLEHLKIKIQLSSIEYAGNIINKNGIINARSVSSSYSNSKKKGTMPKRHKDIESIFEKLKIQIKD